MSKVKIDPLSGKRYTPKVDQFTDLLDQARADDNRAHAISELTKALRKNKISAQNLKSPQARKLLESLAKRMKNPNQEEE